MYDLFNISSSSGAVSIKINEDGLDSVLAAHADALVIADSFFAEQIAAHARRHILIEATEEAKSLENIPAIIDSCRALGLTRGGRILAVGGGVVQDICGFITTIYMRGIPWDFVPTTLLAMADSCIGGKSSINVSLVKNLVGTFHPPQSIVIVPALAETLSHQQIVAGLSEAAKATFARGPACFLRYLGLYDDYVRRGLSALAPLISYSLDCKKWFVEIDEFDQAERLLLNFGHSFGHAIESASDYRIEHGVAVGVGLLAAIEASKASHPGTLPAEETRVLERHAADILAPLADLPDQLAAISRDNFLKFFKGDKKHTPDAFHPILISPGGLLERASLPRNEASEALIWSGFAKARARFRG
jgi:3-dehydroquinate synthase